jgi:PAS domain-containing protein
MSLLIKKSIIKSYIPLASSIPGIHSKLANELNESADQMATLESWKYPVLCHSGTPSSGHDPVFTFVNDAACRLFLYDKMKFIGLKSKLSALAEDREGRSKMLMQAGENGYISNYAGVRVNSQGKRFKIKDALVWTLKDDSGMEIGQATVIPEWESIDS